MTLWKSVPGFEDRIEASTSGLIRDLKRNHIYDLSPHSTGYIRIELWSKGHRKRLYAHRLIAQTFIPNPFNKPQINHKNGIKTDNRVDNLEWATHAENLAHARKTGLAYRKLSDNQIRAIRKERSLGATLKQLGEKYNTHLSNIGYIVNRKHWREV